MRKKYQRVIEIEKCQQAVMLARVSSRKQERGQAYCHRNDLTIVEPTPKAFVFTESSTRGGRKKFNEMIDFIEHQKRKTAIVVHTLDRLQRGFGILSKKLLFLINLAQMMILPDMTLVFYQPNYT